MQGPAWSPPGLPAQGGDSGTGDTARRLTQPRHLPSAGSRSGGGTRGAVRCGGAGAGPSLRREPRARSPLGDDRPAGRRARIPARAGLAHRRHGPGGRARWEVPLRRLGRGAGGGLGQGRQGQRRCGTESAGPGFVRVLGVRGRRSGGVGVGGRGRSRVDGDASGGREQGGEEQRQRRATHTVTVPYPHSGGSPTARRTPRMGDRSRRPPVRSGPLVARGTCRRSDFSVRSPAASRGAALGSSAALNGPAALWSGYRYAGVGPVGPGAGTDGHHPPAPEAPEADDAWPL